MPRVTTTRARIPSQSDIVEPLLILVVLPVLLGTCARLVFGDAKNASLAAAIGALVVTCIAVELLDPRGAWNWLAGLLVSLLPISFAVAAALYWYGRAPMSRRRYD